MDKPGQKDYFCYDWTYKEYKTSTEIHCAMINYKGERCLLRILNFHQFVWLLLSKKFIKKYKTKRSAIYSIDKFLSDNNLNNYKYKISTVIENYQSILATDPTNSNYAVKIFFAKPSNCSKFCYAYDTKLQRYNNNKKFIVPGKILEKDINYILKMITSTDLQYSCWFNFEPIECKNYISIFPPEREFCTTFNTLSKIDPNITLTWVAPLPICSFDAETFSSLSSDDAEVFPDMCNIKDEIYQLSFVYQKNGLPNTKERYLFLVGDCSDVESSPAYEGKKIIVKKYDTEIDMIMNFCYFLIEKDIAILTGFNILKFDIPYINMRIIMREKEWPNLSILKDEKTYIKELVWSSKSYGDIISNLIIALGLINIDMYTYIEKNYKLPNYSLKYVSKVYLNEDEKYDLSYSEQFKIYRERRDAKNKDEIEKANLRMSEVVIYCVQDSELVLNLMTKLSVLQTIISLSCITYITLSSVSTRGQQIRTYSVLYNYCHNYKLIIQKPLYNKLYFKGGKVLSPIIGFHKMPVAVYDFNSLYPTIMMRYNLCYSTYLDQKTAKALQLKGKGDTFNTYKIKANDEPDCNDYIITHFLKEEVKKGILCIILDKLIKERKRVRAPITKLKEELKGLENITENESKIFDITTEIKNRDAIQLAFKVVCNSTYGFTGTSENGIMPLQEIAVAVTHLARKSLNTLSNYFKEVLGENFIMIYGDTDSVMIVDTRLNDKEAYSQYIKFEKYINQGIKAGEKDYNGIVQTTDIEPVFKSPMRIELEKVCSMLNIKKKNYAMVFRDKNGKLKTIIDENGNEVFDIEWRGLPPAKKGTCGFLRKLYTNICQMIFSDCKYLECFKYLMSKINDVLNDKIDYEDYVMMSKFGNTTSDVSFTSVFINQLNKRGKQFVPGDRVRWIMVDIGDRTANQGIRARLYSEFFDSLKTNNPYKIDTHYYIINTLIKKINSLFEVAFKEELDIMYSYPQFQFNFVIGTRQRKPRTLYNPLSLVELCLKNEIPITTLEDFVYKHFDEYNFMTSD